MKAAWFIFFIAVTVSLWADIKVLDDYFEQERFAELENVLASFVENASNDPSVLFFQGYFHNNPDSATKYYRRVIYDYPQSKYADYALFRLGQFSYFENDYAAARHYFSRLVQNFSSSELRDDAQYLYCQCIIAQGKVDSAKLFLKAFVQNVKRSPFVDAAILDLESLGGLPLDRLEPKRTSVAYAIQVASYKDFTDAKNALYKLSRVFPHVEIGERTLGNKTYYHVLIGRFESKEKAIKYANLYIEPHLTEFKIIEHTR